MSLKLKALGLSALAVMAVSAFAAMNASAEQHALAHFTSDSKNSTTFITGKESGTHTTELTVPGLTGIVCDSAHYDGTITSNTVQSITIAPTYGGCKTTGGSAGEVGVDLNGCTYTFTIGKKSTAHNTVDLVCPSGKSVLVTHPSCEITVGAQNNLTGAAYTKLTENEKHTITLDATAIFNVQFHAGICVLLGTSKTAELKGSVTVEGLEDVGGVRGARVNITATGPEG